MTYDVHIEPLAETAVQTDGYEAGARGDGFIYTFHYKAAVGVRGTQKMINRWARCMLTEKGSDLSDPTYGTIFAGLLNGNVGDRGDLTDAILIAVEDCTQQMQTLDAARMSPDDEAIASAQVLDIVETRDGVVTWVELRSVAGMIAKLPLPVVGEER